MSLLWLSRLVDRFSGRGSLFNPVPLYVTFCWTHSQLDMFPPSTAQHSTAHHSTAQHHFAVSTIPPPPTLHTHLLLLPEGKDGTVCSTALPLFSFRPFTLLWQCSWQHRATWHSLSLLCHLTLAVSSVPLDTRSHYCATWHSLSVVCHLTLALIIVPLDTRSHYCATLHSLSLLCQLTLALIIVPLDTRCQ